MEVDESGVARVMGLIDRLNSYMPLSEDDLAIRRQNYLETRGALVIGDMLATGKTLGSVNGSPDIYKLSEAEFKAHMKAIANDLHAQCDLIDQFFDLWLDRAEAMPSGFAARVAVVLRKMKRLDIEKQFLTAYYRHGGTEWHGVGGRKLAMRAEKIGAYDPPEPLEVVKLLWDTNTIEMKVLASADVDGRLEVSATTSCRMCGRSDLSAPVDGGDERLIRCNVCQVNIVSVGAAKALANHLGRKFIEGNS